jgi:hypothetical protein
MTTKLLAGLSLILKNFVKIHQHLQSTSNSPPRQHPSIQRKRTMAVLIRLRTNKAGANGDAAFQSGKEVLKKNISLWSIPYELPATANEDPPTEPVVIRHSFDDLPNGVEVVSYANGFVTGLIRAYHQGLHLRLRPEDVWLSILSQLRVRILDFPLLPKHPRILEHPGSSPSFLNLLWV